MFNQLFEIKAAFQLPNYTPRKQEREGPSCHWDLILKGVCFMFSFIPLPFTNLDTQGVQDELHQGCCLM